MQKTARPALGLAAIAIGSLPMPLDSAVNIAFPSITTAFGMVVEDIRWVIISYVLTHSSLMLVCGRLGDLLGYRRIFMSGLVVTAGAFAVCSLAPTLGILLLGRVLQGVGIALAVSCAPALATSLFDESRRTRVLAAYAAITAAGMALGPFAGGILVEWFGWPVVFWARIPLALLALLLSPALPDDARAGSMRGFDGLGAVLLVACNAGLLLAVAAHSTVFGIELQIAFTVLGIITLIAFIRHNRRSAAPVIRPALFRDRRLVAINLTAISMQFAAFSIMLLVPFWLARTSGLAPGVGGLVLCLAAAGNVVGSSLAGQIAPRVGAIAIAIAGIALSVVGLFGISTWTARTDIPFMAATLLIQGLGLGLFQVAYTDRVVATLPIDERGVAGSMTMVTRTIGVVGAATALAASHRHFEALAVRAGNSAADAFVTGFQVTFRGVAVALAVAATLSLLGLRGGARDAVRARG